MWPFTLAHLCRSAVTYSGSSFLALFAGRAWAMSIPGTRWIAAVCAPETFFIVYHTHKSLSCMRNTTGTSIAVAPEDSAMSAKTVQSFHLAPTASTVPPASTSGAAYTRPSVGLRVLPRVAYYVWADVPCRSAQRRSRSTLGSLPTHTLQAACSILLGRTLPPVHTASL